MKQQILRKNSDLRLPRVNNTPRIHIIIYYESDGYQSTDNRLN